MTHIQAYLLLRLAQWYWDLGKTNRSVDLLGQIVAKAPNYTFAILHLGIRLTKLQRFAEGISHLQKAVHGDPQNVVCLTWLGIAYYESGDYGQAEEILCTALKLDSQNLLISNYLALCLLAKGDASAFLKMVQEQGIFESSQVHLDLLIALERHRLKVVKAKPDQDQDKRAENREKTHELESPIPPQ